MAEGRWRIRLARISLGLAALVFLGFGLLFLFRPEGIDTMDVLVPTTTARTEIRAVYGGLQIGLGVFFAAAAVRATWFRPGLFALMMTSGGLAGGRIVGILAEGSASGAIVLYTAVELAGAALGLVAYLALLGGDGEDRR